MSARGFAEVVGHSTAGGNDIARLYADELSARWHVTADKVQWTGQDDATRIARGFDRVEAFEQLQAIDLAAVVTNQAAAWTDDDRVNSDAEAARAIFDALGADEA